MTIRYVLTLVVTIAIHTTASAQITFTASNSVGALIGQEVHVTEYPAETPDALAALATMTGENVTWDFSGTTFGDPDGITFQYLAPPFTGVPGADLDAFADANLLLVIKDVVSEDVPDSVLVYFYSRITDGGHFNLGFAALVDSDGDGTLDQITAHLDPPELEMPYPATFGTQWESMSTQVFDIDGATIPGGLVSKKTNNIVGWGTLVTPAGSSSALMIHDGRR